MIWSYLVVGFAASFGAFVLLAFGLIGTGASILLVITASACLTASGAFTLKEDLFLILTPSIVYAGLLVWKLRSAGGTPP